MTIGFSSCPLTVLNQHLLDGSVVSANSALLGSGGLGVTAVKLAGGLTEGEEVMGRKRSLKCKNGPDRVAGQRSAGRAPADAASARGGCRLLVLPSAWPRIAASRWWWIMGLPLFAAAFCWIGASHRSGGLARERQMGRESACPAPVSLPVPPGVFSSPTADISAGTWTVAGAEWGFRVRQAGDGQIEALLAELPGGGQVARIAGPDGMELLDVLKSRLAELSREGEVAVYGCDLPSVRIRAFVRETASGSALLGGHLAYPRGPGQWTLTTVVPQGQDHAVGGSLHSLLPLPDDARRIGSRYGDDGCLQCDLVLVRTPLETLVRGWSGLGWRVERLAGPHGEGRTFLCSQGRELVQVSVSSGPEPDEVLLILTSLPDLSGGGDSDIF